MAGGIRERHQGPCRSRLGGRCNCVPSYQARLEFQGEQYVETLDTVTAAKTWRRDALIELGRGRTVWGAERQTLQAVCKEWLELARRGVVRTRSGEPYKPAAVRSYEQVLRLRVWPTLGDEPVKDVRRADLQTLVDELVAAGRKPATIEGAIVPLRSIFRWLVEYDRLTVSPAQALRLPAVRSRRERVAHPVEASRLIATAHEQDRALWATAMYAGLRRGELRALRESDIDLKAGTIDVVAGWDRVEGRQETKGRNRRRVPIPRELREHLAGNRLRTGRRGEQLAFGHNGAAPFEPSKLTKRTDEAWKTAGLRRITLHECRHTYASHMIAAGVNAKSLSDYMGHASIKTTFDLYGHLMPGNEQEAAALLDAYLDAAKGVAQ